MAGLLLYVKLPRTSLTFAGFSYFTCVGKGMMYMSQVKFDFRSRKIFKPRLILNFLCLLGLGDN